MSIKKTSTTASPSNDHSSLENVNEESLVELSAEELEGITGGAHTIEHSGDPVPPPVIHRDVTH